MKNKSTTSQPSAQHLIAGLLQNDSNIEFYGIPDTMEVQWIQNGHTHNFKELPPEVFSILANAFTTNPEARAHLQHDPWLNPISFKRRVELYTYFMYGGLDENPDIVDGELQQHENFRHSEDCPSLSFKRIRLNGCPLKPREIKMIDLMSQEDDYKDEVIATEMGLAVSTYNQHKRELFDKTGTRSRTGLLLAAMRQNIIRFKAACL